MVRFAYTLPALMALMAGMMPGAARAETERDGEVLFNTHCRNCHSANADDHRLGPSLHGIVGAEAGQAKGFAAYSGSLKGFTWDEATLDKFIANPPSVAPNTSMIYPPVEDAAHRKAIIDFIKAKPAK